MGRREFWRAPAGFARRGQRGLIVADREMRDRGVKERAGIVAERRLRRFEARERLGVPSCGLERDAKLEFCARIGLGALDGLAQEFDRRGDVVRPQGLDAAAQ
jgi:hypothetical protein